jgi:purine-binding chemotaxis protein CheW
VEKIHGNSGSDGVDANDISTENLLVFTVQDIRFAVPAGILDHVVRMAAITPVPDPPLGVVGIINYHGDILPVFSFRVVLTLPARSPKPSDFLLIVNKNRNMAIIAEHIDGVFLPIKDLVKPDSITPRLHGISGIYRCNDGLMVITNPDDLLTLDDEESIRRMFESLVAV